VNNFSLSIVSDMCGKPGSSGLMDSINPGIAVLSNLEFLNMGKLVDGSK
jgi:hypothetical protein